MASLPRTYGRRVPLDPTPVPHLAMLFIPLGLLVMLVVIALELIPQARQGLLTAAAKNPLSSEPQARVEQAIVDLSHPYALLSPEVLAWQIDLQRWSGESGLPAALIALVMQIESCGSTSARSPAGAMGLFQVMPFHFSPADNPYEPEINAARGLAYLARAYELSSGAIDKTLAGYNGGHSIINHDPISWPDETQRYVAWGTGLWDEIERGEVKSATLERWLASGGDRLCKQARQDAGGR